MSPKMFFQRLRRLTLRFARRRLDFVGNLARRIWPRPGEEESVLYRGYTLPPRSLRGQMCGEAFQLDSFFLESAVVEATRLTAYLGYVKGTRLVDVGCGLGRLAIGMIAEFGDANYLGIDANKEFLGWCKQSIENNHPGFTFVHFDVANELYNPSGTLTGARIVFPVANDYADIVYLWGVFTNMAPEHVRIYIAEIARIVRDGGKVFLTAFVEEHVPEVTFNPTGYVPYDCSYPLTVVQYNKQWLFSLFEQHGFAVDEFRYHGSMFPKHSEIYLTKTSKFPG